MAVHNEQYAETSSTSLIFKVVVLTLFAIITSIVAVSFASHHMRMGFESEYTSELESKMNQLSANCVYMIRGDELVADSAASGVKYTSVIPAMIVNSEEETVNDVSYALYLYSEGSLKLVAPQTVNSAGTVSATVDSEELGDVQAIHLNVSDWLTPEATPYTISRDDQYTVLTPIKDSTGKVVGVFELTANYSFINSYGSTVEHRVVLSAICSICIGFLLFSIQYILPPSIRLIKRLGGKY